MAGGAIFSYRQMMLQRMTPDERVEYGHREAGALVGILLTCLVLYLIKDLFFCLRGNNTVSRAPVKRRRGSRHD